MNTTKSTIRSILTRLQTISKPFIINQHRTSNLKTLLNAIRSTNNYPPSRAVVSIVKTIITTVVIKRTKILSSLSILLATTVQQANSISLINLYLALRFPSPRSLWVGIMWLAHHKYRIHSQIKPTWNH
jgi:hypothetical protein